MLWVDDNVFIVFLCIFVIDLSLSLSYLHLTQIRPLFFLTCVAQIFSHCFQNKSSLWNLLWLSKKKFILTFLTTGEIYAGSVYTACWKLKAF